MDTEKITKRLKAFADSYDIPGLAVRAVNSKGVLYEGLFGFRDVEAELPVTANTYFGLASVTKSFIGLLLVCLEVDGVLSLDDPVTKHLPEFSYPGLDSRPPVLVKHLVSHTTGIPPLRGLDYALEPWQRDDPSAKFNERDYTNAPDVHSTEAFLEYLSRGEGPLIADPGELVSYSNDTYAVAGALIERVTGESLQAVMDRRVLQPLGLERTTFDLNRVLSDSEATTLYTKTPDGIIHSPTWDQAPAYEAAGFLKSTIADLGRYLQFCLSDGDELGLTEEAMFKTKAAIAWSAPEKEYGLGWTIEHLRATTKLVTHGGSLKGISSHVGFAPQKNFAVAVLTNLDGLPARRIWQVVVNELLGRDFDEPLYSLGNRTMRRPQPLIGRFANGEPWGRLSFSADGNHVRVFSGEDQEDLGLVFLFANDEFLIRSPHGVWEGGRVHRSVDDSIDALQFGARWYGRVE